MVADNAPNVSQPGEGVLATAGNIISNTASAITETVKGAYAGTQKEHHEQVAKGNVPGESGVGDRVAGGLSAVGDKFKETKHNTAADANTNTIKHNNLSDL